MDGEIIKVKDEITKTYKKNPKMWAAAAAGVALLALYLGSKGSSQEETQTAYYAGYPDITEERVPEAGAAANNSDLENAINDLLANTVTFEDFTDYAEGQAEIATETNAALLSTIEANKADTAAQFETQRDYYQDLLLDLQVTQAEAAAKVEEQAAALMNTPIQDINEIVIYSPGGGVKKETREQYYANKTPAERAAADRKAGEVNAATANKTNTSMTNTQKVAAAGLSQKDIDTQKSMVKANPGISFGARDYRNLGLK